ncbi:MAG: hypothetical protein KA436_02395 [Oligoflexales bacterium]|nr:hypothetical protein [Oligoflexales bacterium]
MNVSDSSSLEKWSQILSGISLDRQEQAEVASFLKLQNPETLLNVYSLIKTKGFVSDSFEFLSWGLTRFPKHSTIRVFLARDLYDKGFLQQCLNCLDEEKNALLQNPLAMTLYFKSAVLLQREELARSLWNLIGDKDILSSDLSKVGNALTERGVGSARTLLQQGTMGDSPTQPRFMRHPQLPEQKRPGRELLQSGVLKALKKSPRDRSYQYDTLSLTQVFSPRHKSKTYESMLDSLEALDARIDFCSMLLRKLHEERKNRHGEPFKKDLENCSGQWCEFRSFGNETT